MTNISEFERQKQERIAIIKDLIRKSAAWNFIETQEQFAEAEKDLSLLVKNILIEIDKV